MKPFLIYTSVIGKPDALHDPTIDLSWLDMLCFTDLKYGGGKQWMTSAVSSGGFNNRRRQRQIKLHHSPVFDEYEYSLYIDSNLRLECDPRCLIEMLDPGSDILTFPHPGRDCLYDEAEVCKQAGLDNRDVIDEQTEAYRESGHPEHWGLYAAGFMLRRHTESMGWFSLEWRKEVTDRSLRDQIAMPYLARKLGVKVSLISEGTLPENRFVRLLGHGRGPTGNLDI